MGLHHIDKREQQRPWGGTGRQSQQWCREALTRICAIGPALDPPAERRWRHLEIVSGLWDAIGRHLPRILPAIDIALLHLSAPYSSVPQVPGLRSPRLPRCRASGAHAFRAAVLLDNLRTSET